MSFPHLFTFRRCPYAMRARMALHYAQIPHTQTEVDLKNKPAALRALSPKATVPVLHLPDGTVLEQSLDIMHYAIAQYDPDGWKHPRAAALIEDTDRDFKPLLDRYKYHNRYPEFTLQQHREKGEMWLFELEERLCHTPFLLGSYCTVADIAIFPFIRQWHGVDGVSLLRFPKLYHWLEHHQQSLLFSAIMAPHIQP